MSRCVADFHTARDNISSSVSALLAAVADANDVATAYGDDDESTASLLGDRTANAARRALSAAGDAGEISGRLLAARWDLETALSDVSPDAGREISLGREVSLPGGDCERGECEGESEDGSCESGDAGERRAKGARVMVLPQGMPRVEMLMDWARYVTTVAAVRAAEWSELAARLVPPNTEAIGRARILLAGTSGADAVRERAAMDALLLATGTWTAGGADP